MEQKALLLYPTTQACPYIEGLTFLSESMLISKLETSHMEALLSKGFRHFGDIFFRPICRDCCLCIPIRIPVQQFIFSRSARRLLKRARYLQITLENPVPSERAFALYNHHKKRFKLQFEESYEQFLKSFFYPFPFSRVLCIRDNDHLVAVSHLDVTNKAMSAIYCYYDVAYRWYSPGKLSIYKEIEIAREMGIQWLYLGFYVPGNRHMKYKIDFKPSQLLTTDHHWIDYRDETGKILCPLPQPRFQLLANYSTIK